MSESPWDLRRENGRTVIRLEGALDSATSPLFGRFLETALGADDTRIVLEADGLLLISSAGLRELIRLVKRVVPAGGSVTLAGGSELVVEAVKIAGLGAFLLAGEPAVNAEAKAPLWGRLRNFFVRS